MFGFNEASVKENNQRPVKEKFIIVYDDDTKSVAISLRNGINSKYTCVVWDKKTYDANEVRLSNQNCLIIFNEELIAQNLANPNLIPKKYTNGIMMLIEGNTIGLKFELKYLDESEYLNNLNDILLKPSIWQTWNVYENCKKSIDMYLHYLDIKEKSWFSAVDKLKTESLELFLNGKLG